MAVASTKKTEQSGPSASSLTEWAQQYSVEATPLGRGSFASVYKGVNRRTKEPVAIKVMTKARLGERALHMLSAEINILRTLEHPNVVCLRDSHTTERRILIVLEFCGGGDLGQFIQARGPSPEDTARHFMLQLAAGLAFLRSRRLIHRDIKPQNLLLSERSSRASLKIADFGLARHLPQGSLAESMLGSPLYMAPEVLNNRAYDAKADLWSAGAVLYELVTAKHPFGGANQNELINNIKQNRPRLPQGVTLSPSCIELLGMLLVPHPAERASLQTFLACSFLNAVASGPRIAGGGTNPHVASPRASLSRSHAAAAANAAAAADHSSCNRDARSVPDDYNNAARRATATPSTKVTLRQTDLVLSRPSARLSTERGETLFRGNGDQQETGVRGAVAAAEGGIAVAASRRPSVVSAGDNSAAGAHGGRPDDDAGDQDRASGRGAAQGIRIGEWGWDWNGKGVVHHAQASHDVSDDGSEQGGEDVIRSGRGKASEGPLPELPALPFALGPFETRGAFAGRDKAVGGKYDGAGVKGGDDFAFDLAFAGSPLDGPGATTATTAAEVVGARQQRSFSGNDAVTVTGHGPRRTMGPDKSRRKDTGNLEAPSPGAPPPPASEAADAAPVAPRSSVTPDRHRSHSFSGKGLDADPARLERANTMSESPASRQRASGRGSGPEPVFYLGKGGSVPGPGISPTGGGRHSAPTRRISERAGAGGGTGSLTPPSPVLYRGKSDGKIVAEGSDEGISDGTGGGGGGGYGTSGYGEATPRSSPSGESPRHVSPRAYPSPVSVTEQFESNHALLQQQQQQLAVAGGTSGGGSNSPGDGGGLPMLLKPSFRSGIDSLLTIPEDSTGFVLVTRPSSMACEHGPTCECWTWSGGAGGGGGVVRSPSASYLAAANPYGASGEKASAKAAAGLSNAGALPSTRFLGLGNIWNTAVNTFRGVAGAHGRRSSWPTRRSTAAGQRQPQPQQQQQQQRVPYTNASPSRVALPGRVSTAPASTMSPGRDPVSLSSHSAQYRKLSTAANPGGCGGGKHSTCSDRGGVGGSSSNDEGGVRGVGDEPLPHRRGAYVRVDSSSNNIQYRVDAVYDGRGLLGSPAETGLRRQEVPFSPDNEDLQEYEGYHQRRHSDPTLRQQYAPGLERGAGSVVLGGTADGGDRTWNVSEIAEAQRVKAAADRAEVVGKRSILVVTLADKTAQEAMSLALESPRDTQGSAGLEASADANASAGGSAYARRRHDMLTEALSLYVKALAILQGALPTVLAECKGVPIDGLAAWNSLSPEPNQAHQQQQHQQQHRFGTRHLDPSPSLLAQQSALVTKASWLKELFSQTLQRAEHCRAQASSAAQVAAAAAAAETIDTAHTGSSPIPSPPAMEDNSSSPGSPWVTLGGGSSGGRRSSGAPPSDAAAAAVYRSATEHGQEAAVCYMLGRSDAAITHYVRACALLQLLALEPEMLGGREESIRLGDGAVRCDDGSVGDDDDEGSGNAHGNSGNDGMALQQQMGSGWQAQMLLMADGYARRVELISRGDGNVEQHEVAVHAEGGIDR